MKQPMGNGHFLAASGTKPRDVNFHFGPRISSKLGQLDLETVQLNCANQKLHFTAGCIQTQCAPHSAYGAGRERVGAGKGAWEEGGWEQGGGSRRVGPGGVGT